MDFFFVGFLPKGVFQASPQDLMSRVSVDHYTLVKLAHMCSFLIRIVLQCISAFEVQKKQ